MNDIEISGDRLYEMRIRRDLTLQQAAERIGIHKSTLCRYEIQDTVRVSRDMLDRLSRAYQVMPAQLMPRKETVPGSTWYRILSPEEVSRAYARLTEREKLRVSHLLDRA